MLACLLRLLPCSCRVATPTEAPVAPQGHEESPHLFSMRSTSPWFIEFAGTFCIGLVFSMASGFSHPLATGAIYMAVTYMGAHISGAHFNPVITVTRAIVSLVANIRVKRDPSLKADRNIALETSFTFVNAIAYIFAQLFGAILGCVMGAMALGNQEDVLPRPQPGHTEGEALAVEACFAGILVHVYLVNLVSVHSQHNAFFGLSIGATVIAGMTASQLISGGVFNPAIALGILLANLESDDARNVWLYIVGPPIGALVGVIPYYLSEALQHSDDSEALPTGKAGMSNKPFNAVAGAVPAAAGDDSAAGAHTSQREQKAFETRQWFYNAITEFWGTGIVVFTAGLSIGSNNQWAPLATGAALIGQTFAAGHMSGGMLNPAVNLARLLVNRRRLEDAGRSTVNQVKEAGVYLFAQLLGATVAGFVTRGIMTDDPYITRTLEGQNGFQPLVAETLLTAFVCYVFLQVTSRTCFGGPYFLLVSNNMEIPVGNSFYGAAAGFVYFAAATAAQTIMKFSLNPAIAFGLLLANQSEAAGDAVWPHLLGPFFGSFIAWGLFSLTNEEDAATSADDLHFQALKRPVNEAAGTFFITLVTVMVAAGVSPLAGFAVGAAILGLHFSGMPISGGHFNPAVTFGKWLSNRDLISNAAPACTSRCRSWLPCWRRCWAATSSSLTPCPWRWTCLPRASSTPTWCRSSSASWWCSPPSPPPPSSRRRRTRPTTSSTATATTTTTATRTASPPPPAASPSPRSSRLRSTPPRRLAC